ncbi:HEAT repeat domain-containing protein [Rhizobium leguminosarum]|uniref:HEAT repeat domain-containing protein n=1 Tax=Rhizobium sp. PRIMUS64 TaxID=2908925 RepID=UPI001FF15329|nr:HEAT repeat domain-containing protein [Rhizobium sp. PRIMUS64]MCJ9695320.1 HEAT repeat domain-containing protein [Rhizobium sp. PRIMUS64]
MRLYLEEIISRMCLKEPGVSSADSKSWHAYREAERLSDAEVIQEICHYLEKKRNAPQRSSAYFILGKVGKNLANAEATQLLLMCISTEVDKYALSTALDMISELALKADEDISMIINLLQDRRWLVRHAAIRALKSSKSAQAEKELIALLGETNDVYDKIYCHVTLGVIGTAQALPAIQINTKSRKPDLKVSAVHAIESIKARIDALKVVPI